eukprot:7944201-Alexandrium_andersonii.AAC.1
MWLTQKPLRRCDAARDIFTAEVLQTALRWMGGRRVRASCRVALEAAWPSACSAWTLARS